jgi:hypothetical protein
MFEPTGRLGDQQRLAIFVPQRLLPKGFAVGRNRRGIRYRLGLHEDEATLLGIPGRGVAPETEPIRT